MVAASPSYEIHYDTGNFLPMSYNSHDDGNVTNASSQSILHPTALHDWTGLAAECDIKRLDIWTFKVTFTELCWEAMKEPKFMAPENVQRRTYEIIINGNYIDAENYAQFAFSVWRKRLDFKAAGMKFIPDLATF